MLFKVKDEVDVVEIKGYSFYKFTENTIKIVNDILDKTKVKDACFGAHVVDYILNRKSDVLFDESYLFKVVDGMICVFTYKGYIVMQYSPIGTVPYSTKYHVLRKCIKMMYVINGLEDSVRILSCTEEFYKMLNFNKLRKVDNYVEEFVFSTDTLRNLDGKHFKSIRNTINKFIKNNDFVFREYEDSDYSAAVDCYTKWCVDYENKQKVAKENGISFGERIIDRYKFSKWLKYRKILNMKIYVVVCNNVVIGIGGISKLCEDSSIVIFERCDNSFVGICEYLWVQMVRTYDYYPFEQDGDGGSKLKSGKHKSGLFDYKMKFQPVELVQCYELVLNKVGEKITKAYFVDIEE